MPKILRRALLERIQGLEQFRIFVEDFRTLTGLDLMLLDQSGCPVSRELSRTGLCRAVQQSREGMAVCERTRRELLVADKQAGAGCACEAGLHEVSVPVQINGQTVGFLVIGGFQRRRAQQADVQRIAEKFAQWGIKVPRQQLDRMLGECPIVSQDASDAMMRIVAASAKHFGHLAARQVIPDTKLLPAVAHRVRRYVRANGLGGPCRLPDIARACGVSPAHLSRVFHQSTGLTISDYLARFRVGQVMERLKKRRHSVTDIAFACGFQSLSQFNRTFRRIVGCSPTQYESAARARDLIVRSVAEAESGEDDGFVVASAAGRGREIKARR